ncbi:MAG: NADH-quinone oxidoreductase subunit N [Pseudomonadota bacterium]
MLDWAGMAEIAAPELWLAATALIGVLLGAALKDAFNRLAFKFASVALLIASYLAFQSFEGGTTFNGLYQTSAFVSFAKIASFALAAVALWNAEGFLERHETIRYEFALLMIFACLGMGITLSAADLMTLYLGIETLSLSSYVLASFHRDVPRSAEAGLKYFVLGALASGMLLYGASLVYGFTGSTLFVEIAAAEVSFGYLFGMVLMITGLAFKVSAAPMHVWTPDVYEGSPTPVVAFFAAAPKFAMIVVFANIMFTVYGRMIEDWQLILSIIAGASMLVGSVGALSQTNIKRLLGYSSIANMGYALIPVAAGGDLGAPAILVFMTIYTVGAVGLFAGVLTMRRRGGMVEDIQELSGLIRTQPAIALALTAIIFSIAGIPPLAGFFGKLAVFEAAMSAELIPLVVVLVLSSVISLGYYLRLVVIMWVEEPRERFEYTGPSVALTVVGTGLMSSVVLVLGIGVLDGWARLAATGLVP